MKKKIFSLMIGAVIVLASCNKSDDVPTAPQTDATTFTLAIDELQTRATSTVAPARYIMEVWSEDGTIAENVFDNAGTSTNRKEVTSGSITVVLDKTKAYTCLFWADDNAVFNAASLKEISLNTDKSATEAYFSNVAVAKGKNPAVAVTLKRAVAKITLTETSAVTTSDNLALKLTNIYPTFNVLAGEATGTAAEWTKTIKPSATTGAIATFYFFAKAEKALSDLTFTYAAETAKTVSNIPVQQNHATSIKGEFSNLFAGTFTITADDAWTTPDNEVNFTAKVGDFYYSDNTFSNTIDAAKTCIGIVYIVNADGKTGQIVGLIEATNKTWGAYGVNEPAVGIDSETDGATATKNLITARKDEANFATNYSAFEWVYTTVNNSDINGRWYLPAKEELLALYAAWNGDATTTANTTARTAFNTQLTAASGEAIRPAAYWSSTQVSGYYAWYVDFYNGGTFDFSKDGNLSVRVVSAF